MKSDGLTTDEMNTDEMNILKEIGEWTALGFYEAVNEPWPRAYGRAYRRLYENMGVVIPENRLLIPCEPSPNAWSREDHDLWTPMGFIVDHNHNTGLSLNPKYS